MCKRKISRRAFLGQASCAAIGSTAFLSSVLNLGMINTVSARPHILDNSGDYKAMVCVLLAGGADTFNVLVPTDTTPYNDYLATRGSLALDTNVDPGLLLPLNNGMNVNGAGYAVHSGMTEVRDMFNASELSFVANIGTLIEPITDKYDYQNGNKLRPLGLYSHSDQIMQWQTSVPQTRSAVGVAGRMADLLHDMNSIEQVSMNISLSGKNRFQAGNEYNEYSIRNNATADGVGYDGFSSGLHYAGMINDARNNAIDSLVEQEYANIFHETFADLTAQTTESNDYISTALANVGNINVNYANTGISQDMRKIVELISVREHLGAQRQIFFVTYGGWDHHDNVLGNQANMLPVLSRAFADLNAGLKAIGMFDNVVSFTISDFARTLTSNGNGSDHAWGGNQMIMGGPIIGKQIFGQYPSLHLDSDLNLSTRGRILPTTSVDEFYAELALWFGASPNDLDYILPNLCNFYSASCPAAPPNQYLPIGMFNPNDIY